MLEINWMIFLLDDPRCFWCCAICLSRQLSQCQSPFLPSPAPDLSSPVFSEVLQFFEKAREPKIKTPNIFSFCGKTVLSLKAVLLFLESSFLSAPGTHLVLVVSFPKTTETRALERNPLWCQGEPSSSPAAEHQEKDFWCHVWRESDWVPGKEGMGFEGWFFYPVLFLFLRLPSLPSMRRKNAISQAVCKLVIALLGSLQTEKLLKIR